MTKSGRQRILASVLAVTAAILVAVFAGGAAAYALGVSASAQELATTEMLAQPSSLDASPTPWALTTQALGSQLGVERADRATQVAATPKLRARAAKKASLLLKRARAARADRRYTAARTLYRRARILYLRAGKAGAARTCLTGMQDLFLIMGTYPSTRAEMAQALAEAYPGVPVAQRRAWLDRKSSESLVYDGVRHYYGDLPSNIAFRDFDLFHTLPDKMAHYRQAYELIARYMSAAADAPSWQPYATPTTYSFVQTLTVPRAELPATGDLRVWLPLPLEGGPQTDVRISEVTPSPWFTLPPTLNEGISLLHLRVPLARLDSDLDFSFRVSFKHAAQYFKVDPARVGRYDKRSALYRRYTASRGNITITPGIRRTARRVVGGETNPYLAARRLYRYVIKNVRYSFMPHLALWPRGIPESVYVHGHKYGDCGAQSMYFSALCRAVGIPARTTGGFQLFTGVPSGHFWAEFYVPGYGWLPVDPTAAEIVDYLPDVSPAEKQAFHDFCFGNQDDLRLTVQRDVDLPLMPAAYGRVAVPMAIQLPAAVCGTMTTPATLWLTGHWRFE